MKYWSAFPLFCVLIAFEALGASSRAVLPEGVWHPSIRFGYVSEVSNRYDNSGSYQSVGRLNQAFTGDRLRLYSAEFREFANVTDTLFPHSNYADQVSVGAIEFEANANVQYTAPVLAYGLTKRLTVALGVPIVTLDAEVTARQTGSNNSAAVCAQIASQENMANFPELAQACQRLRSVDVRQAFYNTLETRGYEVPGSTSRTVLGDMMLAGVYQYFETKRWILWQQTTLNLPTGPEDDPDDFLDIPVFHQTSLKFDFHQDYRLTGRWTLGSLFGYHWKIPDSAEKRVPENENDMLPKAERKERVARDLGDIWTLGTSTNYWITNAWNLNAGYDYNYKQADRYAGERGYNYGLLSRDTQGYWHRVSGGFTFSTIDMYFAQEFAVPFQVSYLYSDIVAGVNIDRQVTHEFTLKMYF